CMSGADCSVQHDLTASHEYRLDDLNGPDHDRTLGHRDRRSDDGSSSLGRNEHALTHLFAGDCYNARSHSALQVEGRSTELAGQAPEFELVRRDVPGRWHRPLLPPLADLLQLALATLGGRSSRRALASRRA